MGLNTKPVSGDQGIDWGLSSGEAELSKLPPIRRQPPQQQPEPLKCPRCGSTNTKFCYYNNYNKSQPRHFCKSCKRHWTKGGTLRNVPVGGGRKNKRPKISNSATTSAAAASPASTRHQDFPCFSSSGDQRNISSNILYQALIRSSSSTLLHETTKGIDISIPRKPFMGSDERNTMNSTGLNVSSGTQNASTEFQFSSLNTFEMDPSLIPNCGTSYPGMNHFTVNLDSVEESTVTTVNIPSNSSGPWPGPDTSSGLDLPNYWNWNDIDVLTSTDDLNISWDDDGGEGSKKIKP